MTVSSESKQRVFFNTGGAPPSFRVGGTPSTSSSSPYVTPSYYYGGQNLLDAADGYPAFNSTRDYASLNPNPIGAVYSIL